MDVIRPACVNEPHMISGTELETPQYEAGVYEADGMCMAVRF
jgi:hypothetical protein